MRLLLLITFMLTTLWSSKLDDQISIQIQNQPNTLQSLYKLNMNKPLWIGHANNFHAFMKLVKTPYYNYKNKRFALKTVEQYVPLLRNDIDINQNSTELAKLDIALTQSYIGLANFIVQSDVDWDLVQTKLLGLKESKDIRANWEMTRKSVPTANALYQALVNENIHQLFKSLTPLPDRHLALIKALGSYQNYKDVTKLPYGSDLKYADSDSRIPAIKERLVVSGDFPRQAFYSEEFGDKLKKSMDQYKDRFNLEMNGKIDKVMIYYLNKKLEPKIQQIITNLDKLKVFPNSFPKEAIIINIPDFSMEYYTNGYSTSVMNTVVGRSDRPTPIFSSKMSHMVLNPTWTVPNNLIRRDLIKALKENPNYMKEHNMHVYKGWNNKTPIKNFDINKLLKYEDPKSGTIPYRIVQAPGSDNALGRVKFMFPNKYDVYLHDTDNKELLDRRYRIYSSGCMRLQNPFRFVEMIKDKFKNGVGYKVDKYLTNGKTVTMRLKSPLAVQTTYFTVFVRNGINYFRKDIYGYDKFIQESVKRESSLGYSTLY